MSGAHAKASCCSNTASARDRRLDDEFGEVIWWGLSVPFYCKMLVRVRTSSRASWMVSFMDMASVESNYAAKITIALFPRDHMYGNEEERVQHR